MKPKSWQPVSGQIMTQWAQNINPAQPFPEYPRPQMQRSLWQNLNGLWEYTITTKHAPQPSEYQGTILVPFAIESALSGVKRPLKPKERLWYHRTFSMDRDWKKQRVLIHLGAVDWEANIYLNGLKVGSHRGGYCPFSFDITESLQAGENELVVSVWDPSDHGKQEHGKQVLKPSFIWYSAVSGIWQTVWLEVVPTNHITSLKMTPDIDKETINLLAFTSKQSSDLRIQAIVKDGKRTVVEVEGAADATMEIHIPSVKLWSPDSPHLYDLEVKLHKAGKVLDQVASYFGMRKFSLGTDSNGVPRLCLNNKPIFQYGLLDQGYWPDGLYTPPSDEAMRYDIEFCKQAGFNMIRKHIKVEPARYYYYCDKIGIILWQDMINGGKTPNLIWSLLAKSRTKFKDTKKYSRSGRHSKDNRKHYRQELKEMIDTLYNVVSIGLWVPFNEGWGQFNAEEIANWVKNYDPTRLVDHASGWFDQGAGDCRSLHTYFKRLIPAPFEKKRATILSEFGGFSLSLPGHNWKKNKQFGYKNFKNREALTRAYKSLLETELLPWVKKGLSAAVYTQTTDIEGEINGFLSYDRKVIKIDPQSVVELHKRLYEESPH